MLVYRMITKYNDNIKKLKEKQMCWSNFPKGDDFCFTVNSNTFNEDKKHGTYFYFFAEDAIRMVQMLKEYNHVFWEPHIAEFDISVDLLSRHLGLGIYKNYCDRNYLSEDYYIALEFVIPYKTIIENYGNVNGQYSCITDKLYSIPFYHYFEEAEIPDNIGRDNYKNFNAIYLPKIMQLLNVDLLSFSQNKGSINRNNLQFSKCADNYSEEKAVKILKRLNSQKK